MPASWHDRVTALSAAPSSPIALSSRIAITYAAIVPDFWFEYAVHAKEIILPIEDSVDFCKICRQAWDSLS